MGLRQIPDAARGAGSAARHFDGCVQTANRFADALRRAEIAPAASTDRNELQMLRRTLDDLSRKIDLRELFVERTRVSLPPL